MRHVIIATESSRFANKMHFFILKPSKCGEYYILINPLGSPILDIKVITTAHANKIISKLPHVYYDILPTNNKIGSVTFLSCVNFIKLYFGIKKPSILTDGDLMEYLFDGKISNFKKYMYPLRFVFYYLKYFFIKDNYVL